MDGKIGKDIPAQEAADLLLRLIVDRTIVQAVLTSNNSSCAALIGVVYPAQGGAAMVKAQKESEQPILRFDPSEATSFRLGDGRAFSKGVFEHHRVNSALSFCYPDKTHVTLLALRPVESEPGR